MCAYLVLPSANGMFYPQAIGQMQVMRMHSSGFAAVIVSHEWLESSNLDSSFLSLRWSAPPPPPSVRPCCPWRGSSPARGSPTSGNSSSSSTGGSPRTPRSTRPSTRCSRRSHSCANRRRLRQPGGTGTGNCMMIIFINNLNIRVCDGWTEPRLKWLNVRLLIVVKFKLNDSITVVKLRNPQSFFFCSHFNQVNNGKVHSLTQLILT